MFGLQDLTPKERCILTAMLNPDYRELNITQVCKVAGTNVETYRRAMQKPHFIEAIKIVVFRILKQDIIPILSAVIREAKKGSYQHSKMLFEMAGLYQPQGITLLSQVLKITQGSDVADEEIDRRIAERLTGSLSEPEEAIVNNPPLEIESLKG